MSYQKGDIIWVNYPFADSAVTKARPALVVSNSTVNDTGDYLLVQITSRVKGDGLSIEITESDYQSDPLQLRSFVRFHKIFLLHESLILRKVSSVQTDLQKLITERIISILI